jgi:hypothetical protein
MIDFARLWEDEWLTGEHRTWIAAVYRASCWWLQNDAGPEMALADITEDFITLIRRKVLDREIRCRCGRVFVGNHDTGTRNWNPDCPVHPWDDRLQAQADRAVAMQLLAREARRKAREPWYFFDPHTHLLVHTAVGDKAMREYALAHPDLAYSNESDPFQTGDQT